MSSRTTSGRIFFLDAARAAAIVLVALNHAVNRAYDNYHGQMEEFYSRSLLSASVKASLTVASHLGVPLFLMITGALLLGRSFSDREALKRFYLRNAGGILLTSEIWMGIIFSARISASLHRGVPRRDGDSEYQFHINACGQSVSDPLRLPRVGPLFRVCALSAGCLTSRQLASYRAALPHPSPAPRALSDEIRRPVRGTERRAGEHTDISEGTRFTLTDLAFSPYNR